MNRLLSGFIAVALVLGYYSMHLYLLLRRIHRI